MDTETRRPPSNVIDLAPHLEEATEYQQALRDACDWVAQTVQTSLGAAFGLALAGELREWAAAQPVGTAIVLEPRLLQSVADPNVAAIVELYLDACVLLGRLKGEET